MATEVDGTACKSVADPHSTTLPCGGSKASSVILNFTPSWFSVNMGTGIVGILLYTAPYKFPGQSIMALIIYFLNMLLFLLFATITSLRYILYPWTFKLMLKFSAQAMFLGTIPMGLATIVNATALQAVPHVGVGLLYFTWGVWWFDVLLSVLSAVGVPFLMFHVHNLSLDKMTAAWLLPVVPLVVAASSGAVVASKLPPDLAQITLFVSYAIWGAGMGLSFMIMALYLHRLAIHHLPGAEVVVSAYLPLGPLGQGAFGIMQASVVGRTVFPATGLLGVPLAGDFIYVVSHFTGLLLWGLGLWWLVHGTYSVLLRCIKDEVHFNMGFWGFIFPLGVFTSATISLGKDLPSAFFRCLAMAFIVVLVCLYIFVAGKTLFGATTKKLFVAPCLSTMKAEAAAACSSSDSDEEQTLTMKE